MLNLREKKERDVKIEEVMKCYKCKEIVLFDSGSLDENNNFICLACDIKLNLSN